MAMSRCLIGLVAAAALAIVAALAFNSSPVSETPPALAGPCGADPWLHKESQSPGADPIKKIRVFTSEDTLIKKYLAVDTIPPQLPDGKPPVTITVSEVDGHDEIDVFFTPSSSDGSFETKMKVDVGPNVPAGTYTYKITLFCHTQTYEVDVEVWVNQCPVDQLPAFEFDTNARHLSRQIAGPTEEPDFPDTCEGSGETPTPTPGACPVAAAGPVCSPTPTVVPTFSPSPTPSGTPSTDTINWGDSDCSGGVDPIDSLKTLRTDGGLPVQQVPFCPAWNALVRILTELGSRVGVQGVDDTYPWGDVDCSSAVNPIDSLKILRTDAGLGVEQPGGCPDIGQEVEYEVVEG